MRLEDFVGDPLGGVEMVDNVFTFSPGPLSPDREAIHALIDKNGDAMYAASQLFDLD